MTKEKEKEIDAIAFSHLFCNVGESDWPKDPIEVLNKAMDNGAYATDIGEYCDDEDEDMVVWEPFENYSAEFLVDEFNNLVADMTRLVEGTSTATA